MLIKDVKIRKKEGFWDISIKNGLIERIDRNISPEGNQEVIEGNKGFVMPPYVDSHGHLDYVGTTGDPVHNLTGTLLDGIKIWGQRKKTVTKEDVKTRSTKILKWMVAQGTQYVRTHVNTDEEGLVSMEAMLEVKKEMAHLIDVQIVAFPQQGILNFKNGLELLEEGIKMGADAVGAIPHFEDIREESTQSIMEIFRLADKYDVLIDVHCDETDDDHSRAIEVVASQAYRSGMGSRVTASHTTAMHSYNGAYVAKLFGMFNKSKMNFVCNPTINTHLQGRYDSYPKRRGVTRVKELLEAGLNVSFGNDDIMDPFYPLGTGDMLEVLFMGVHVCHLTGHTQLLDSLDLITVNGAKTLNITDRYGVEVGKPGNLIILPGIDEYDIIRRHVKPTYNIRKGKVIAKTDQAKHMINDGASEEAIDFIV